MNLIWSLIYFTKPPIFAVPDSLEVGRELVSEQHRIYCQGCQYFLICCQEQSYHRWYSHYHYHQLLQGHPQTPQLLLN